MNTFSFILGGVSFVFFGIMVIIKHRFCHWAYAPYCADFTGYSTPFGSILILIGILLLWSEIRRLIKNRSKKGH
jgi:hypothetical protein